MSASKLEIILFSSFLIFATAPLSPAQSTENPTQDQTTKKKQNSTTNKETGNTTQQNAPASENKAGSTEKTQASKTKKSKKTSSLSQDKIRKIQMSLKNEGYDPGPIDGIIGSMTMMALRNYQSHNKLAVTGTLTPETESALMQGAAVGTKRSSLDQSQQAYETGQTSQSLGTTGTTSEPVATSVDDVKQVQTALIDLGYNPGDVNGMMSTETQQAIREFQWLNDLPVTGIVDQQTKTALDLQWNGGV